MSSISVASSRGSNYGSPSPANQPPASLVLSNMSASSSRVSFTLEDEENDTITSSHAMAKRLGKRKSQDDIRLLAVSTHMTEISYAISDIQTRIFEIQELRHKSQSSGDHTGTTGVIDQSLITLDERLDSVEKGIKNINETLGPFLQNAATPTVSENGSTNENAGILRKHATLLSEWEAVQDESDVLREELKEDKWLTVFRTVTDQADGMMSSLEKAVNRCQEFIWQVHRRGVDDLQTNAAVPPPRHERPTINFEAFISLLDSYDAKKKHYMPATSKVLSIIDKGVRDRVTKNGETLRRHAESAQRWKSLRDRISRTDTEMENTRKFFLGGDAGFSDQDSNTSGTPSTKNGYLATPTSTSASRSSKGTSASGIALSRSISPFRKLARRITGNSKPNSTSVSPLVVKKVPLTDPPTSMATIRRQRASLFGSTRGSEPPTPSTPERPSHKHSQSYTPDSSPQCTKVDANATITSRTGPSKQRWNSSTKVDPEDRSLASKGTASKRPPSAAGYYGYNDDIPPVPPLNASYRRSLSRASMASSRPWSPITSSVSTTQSSSQFYPPMPIPTLRTPSRAQTPSRAITPSLSTTPRSRAKTPSHIPAPSKSLRSVSLSGTGRNEDDRVFQRAFSPAFSVSELGTSSPPSHPPRPPSRSMIPVPSVHLHTPSRPSSSLSNFSRSESPTMRVFRHSAMGAQTPELTLRARPRMLVNKLPPSSFRDGNSSRAPSRPGSRTGAYTPALDGLALHEYIAGNIADPLDAEVATIVNSIVHGLLVERVDPPLRKNQIPKEGEEIKAQYAFTNSLSRKVVTCRLTTLSRSSKTGSESTTTKKVMCRVGGGWQDLSHYILSRQAGQG